MIVFLFNTYLLAGRALAVVEVFDELSTFRLLADQ